MTESNFVFKTTSISLKEQLEGIPTKIRLFNFANPAHDLLFSGSKSSKQKIGSYDATWIRIFIGNKVYYDFITSQVFFVQNKEGIMVLCSEDTELITPSYFAKDIMKFIHEDTIRSKTNEKYLTEFYKNTIEHLNNAYEELRKFYSLQKQIQSGRLNIEDSFQFSKNELTKNYLKDLILKKIISNNKNEILKLLD